MTYEEALIDLQSIYKGHGGLYTDDSPAWKLAFDALEKQIPKKPVRIAGNILFACPNDRWHQMTVDNRNKFPFCPICGQAMDWSDVQ